jgi:insertion element IS1 protein InsB
VQRYYTDGWEVYAGVIPPGQLVQSKAETNGVERNNCRQRHWFARFHRKSIVVSRSLQMVNLTVALFAAYHVNHTLEIPVSLFS